MPARLAAVLLLGLALTANAAASKKTRTDGVASTRTPLAYPLPGLERALRDNFHEKRGVRSHQALDIMAPRGTPVHAVDDGTVAKLYRGALAGIAVYQFDAAQSRVYMYAHLDRHAPGLVEGQGVKRGQIIGFVGSTGNAPESAPHLHFAMHELAGDKRWWKGTAVNPYPLLREPLATVYADNRGSNPRR